MMNDTDEEDADTIHKAARRFDLDALRHFVEVKGVDVDCRDNGFYGMTPLDSVVAQGRISKDNAGPLILSYLISNNANVEATKATHASPLIHASAQGNQEAVEILLIEGRANVNYKTLDSSTALTCAASDRKGFPVVPTLLQHGAHVDPCGRNIPLVNACKCLGSAGVIQQLLKHGADATTGGNAICLAAAMSDAATVRLLLLHGANANALHNRESPLSYAVDRRNVDVRDKVAIVQALLENDAKVGTTLEYKDSVLHRLRDSEICHIILSHCRRTMKEHEFCKLLLRPEMFNGNIALHDASSVEIAQRLVEQPRMQNNQLSVVCWAQLVCENDRKLTPLQARVRPQLGPYLKTFESLALTVPTVETTCFSTSASTKRQKVAKNKIAVKINPALNDFQRSVAEEALSLLIKTMGFQDLIAHAILGYLSPLDVMKRTGYETT